MELPRVEADQRGSFAVVAVLRCRMTVPSCLAGRRGRCRVGLLVCRSARVRHPMPQRQSLISHMHDCEEEQPRTPVPISGCAVIPPGGTCIGTGWSPVESASANSQLAGVLAGFVFAGIVMVLTEGKISTLRVATLRLFIAGFIVLGLDSYSFSILTGDIAEGACGRVWTESLIASGMLVVGTVAVISGISWLLAAYIENQGNATPEQSVLGHIEAMRIVERLLRRSVYGITVMTVILLSTVAHDYVNVAFHDRPKPWWATWISPVYVLLVGAAMIGAAWQQQRTCAQAETNAGEPSSLALSVAFTGAVSYAIVGTGAIGFITSTPTSFWNPIPGAVAFITVAIVLIMPVPTILTLIYAMPRHGVASADPGLDPSPDPSPDAGPDPGPVPGPDP